MWSQNDLLQWIIETAVQRKASVYDMVGRIQLIGFAAIHTSSDVSPDNLIVFVKY